MTKFNVVSSKNAFLCSIFIFLIILHPGSSENKCCKDYVDNNCNDASCNLKCVQENFCDNGVCKIRGGHKVCHCAC
ncbi:hypothetical protein Lalb_Chr12g0205761 [Lupinus albus]|uniref:Knottin, scorpion toxin n=1 Tax=Lupinus albus TaxID=3870 RepID=A0A6A4PNC2_LUPAL|nr:hypothetical protein Lalb_Chr12g0205761 [Lupinus albus]